MRRRDLLVLVASTPALWPVAAHAQQKAMRVIGFLSLTSPDSAAQNLSAIWQGLNETGYTEGRNAAGEYRFADSQYDRLPALAADLVARKVDVIATQGGPLAAGGGQGGATADPNFFLDRPA